MAERVRVQVVEDGMVGHIQRFFEPDHAPLPEPDWVGYAMDVARLWVESVDPSEWHIVNGFHDRSADKDNCIALIAETGMAFKSSLAGPGGLAPLAVQAWGRWRPQ